MMRLSGLRVALGAGLLLSGCAAGAPVEKPVPTRVSTAQDVMDSLHVYIDTSRREMRLHDARAVSAEVFAQMKQKDFAAYAALVPLRTEARSGQPIDQERYVAAQAVLGDFVNYVTLHDRGMPP